MSKKAKRLKEKNKSIHNKNTRTQNNNGKHIVDTNNNNENRNKDISNKKSYSKIIVNIILIGVLIFSLVNIVIWYLKTEQDENNLNDLKNQVVAVTDSGSVGDEQDGSVLKAKVDFQKLHEINNEIKGWITISELGIDYPVLQHSDNQYYLKRDFNKNSNQSGSIYLDYRNNEFKDQKTVIYGHNMRNGTMFASLAKIVKKEVGLDIKVYIETEKEILEYQVFSAYRIPTSDFDRNETIEQMIKSSEIEFAPQVKNDDKIVTLYTCTNTSDSRIIVHAVLVQTVEK